ncbi:hypothetical protein DFJ67_5062 [Asanoa ferruginea]|uniref:Uncharacterized protein n=1 Tax=Asanoa ferruginea TaxID=53367 RepID=A0A3D9ZNT6_9ACTN|nr:hypothetical protein [Asanoa ferruginea]REF99036.1 hypothetical protein DFJ67_5062 [Asanoa ferruginea]GIF46280.1 hypothetical protein Afe04nite_08190 [Asanoa ferruginea]
MTRVMNRLGDRMLGLLIQRSDAGACVPEMGQSCGCFGDEARAYCIGNQTLRRPKYIQKISCTGGCYWTNTLCGYENIYRSYC